MLTPRTQIVANELEKANSDSNKRLNGQLLYAHRGVRQSAHDPGNNIMSIQLAAKLRVPVELDVFPASNGKLIVSHGPCIKCFRRLWRSVLSRSRRALSLSEALAIAEGIPILLELKAYSLFTAKQKRELIEILNNYSGSIFVCSFDQGISDMITPALHRPIGIVAFYQPCARGLKCDFLSLHAFCGRSSDPLFAWTYRTAVDGIIATRSTSSIPICDTTAIEMQQLLSHDRNSACNCT